MQFKRPTAYPESSTSKVITDRKKVGLTTHPHTLYFPLRQKQPTHKDFQHNVLFRLRQKLLKHGLGDATYVCPLFLDRSTYRFNMHRSSLWQFGRFWRLAPWELEEVLVEDGGNRTRFDRIPVLAEHISVPPHIKVTSAAHRYSFSEKGTELCFHSPEVLPEGSMGLPSFLAKVSSGFLDGGEKLAPDGSHQVLDELITEVYGDREREAATLDIESDDPLGRWFAWGDHLRTEYSIEQFALVLWKDEEDLLW